MSTPDYRIKKGYVLSNDASIQTSGRVTYLPIYDIMFLGNHPAPDVFI